MAVMKDIGTLEEDLMDAIQRGKDAASSQRGIAWQTITDDLEETLMAFEEACPRDDAGSPLYPEDTALIIRAKYAIARALRRQKDYSGSIAVLENLLPQKEIIIACEALNISSIHRALGEAYECSGRPQIAANHFQIAAETAQDDETRRKCYARAGRNWEKSKLFAKAGECFLGEARCSPEADNMQSRAYKFSAGCFAQMGQETRAKELFKKARAAAIDEPGRRAVTEIESRYFVPEDGQLRAEYGFAVVQDNSGASQGKRVQNSVDIK